ncbi:MAG: EscN/YscN/HrcN family type III secretion system ATPase, partial [Planctomycetes bacterium]|nr:EscN/YscN/HrcN family type III secretion system ATPase [Planctomycetota bacterium]
MSTLTFSFQKQIEKLKEVTPLRVSGQVSRIVGLMVECEGLSVPVGALCEVRCRESGRHVEAEVVGFHEERALLMPYGTVRGIARYDRVRLVQRSQKVGVGPALLGRVIDGRGRPIDGKGLVVASEYYPIFGEAPEALSRRRVKEPFSSGIKTIDGLFTLGVGQRVGIFSGSGVGKSMLMGMIARNCAADVAVIALV